MTSDRSSPGQPGDEERDEPELSLEELESETAGSLPDRRAMSTEKPAGKLNVTDPDSRKFPSGATSSLAA